MDRPRSDRQHPLWLKLKRVGGAAFALVVIVFGVASIPPLVLTFWVDPGDLRPAAGARLGNGPEPVHFRSGATSLRGMLMLPGGPGPHPGIVIVHGSGRQTAESFQSITSFFSAEGYAVLAYDKRGTGRSDGMYRSVGVGNSHIVLSQLAEDAASALRFLRNRQELDPERLGYVGFSQAGWIVPQAVSRTPSTAFSILFSGPTVSVGEEIYYSRLTGDDFGSRSKLSEREVHQRLAEFEGPNGFDPVPALLTMEIPALWVLGERDQSIPVLATIEIIRDLIEKEKKSFSVHLFPNGDHSLRDADSGQRLQAFPVALEWLNRVAGRPSR